MSLAIEWVTAFLDLPSDRHADAVRFWTAVTGTTLSPPRGAQGQFATLVPADGTGYLKLQRLDQPPRVHLDLSVADVRTAREQALALGAIEVADCGGHVILRSPGGFVFCLVPHPAGPVPGPQTWPGGQRSRLAQVCLDVPTDLMDAEVDFVGRLTGWRVRAFPAVDGVVAFQAAASPEGSELPLRVIAQRLGPDDAGPTTRAHLEFWSDDVAAEVSRHRELGARQVFDGAYWVVLRDPAGLDYCVIGRDPVTGRRV